MKTELVRLDSLMLGGMIFYGDPFSTKSGWDEDNEIGKTCRRFIDFIAEKPERPYSAHGDYLYEVHIYNAETAVKGYFEVFVGEAVNTVELPVTLSVKFFPASEYVKIILSGDEISGDWWKKLDKDIIPAGVYKRNTAYIIQAYDERFKGMDNITESVLDVFIPIEKL